MPVTQLPMFVLLTSATEEIEAPLALLERWLWLGFLALVVSSAGMIARALYSFRHYDRRLLRECGLATGVIEGTSDMVWVKDADGRYLLVNEPGAEFLHHTKEEIVGRTDTEVMSEKDAARTLKYDREVLDSPLLTGLDQAHQRVGAGLVAEKPGKEPLLRPAPVAIHDDGHMAR